MKKTFLLIPFLATLLSIVGAQESVVVYHDFVEDALGRSPYREILVSINPIAFTRTSTMDIPEEGGWLTAVFVSRDTELLLDSGMLPISSYIEKIAGVYYLNYNGIECRFSLEPPTKELFDLVDIAYRNDESSRQFVTNWYKEGRLVRIYSAENIINPETTGITYDEAMIMATLLGDKVQWFWGIHDAYSLLTMKE